MQEVLELGQISVDTILLCSTSIEQTTYRDGVKKSFYIAYVFSDHWHSALWSPPRLLLVLLEDTCISFLQITCYYSMETTWEKLNSNTNILDCIYFLINFNEK